MLNSHDRSSGMSGKDVRSAPQKLTQGDAVDDIVEQWRRARPELDVSPLEVFGRLHRTFLVYRAEINATFARTGSSEPGFDVLAALRRSSPTFTLTAGELAEQTLVTTGGLSLRIRKLEDEGLVVRRRDENDHRIVHVQLTAAGLLLIDRTALEHYENLRGLLAGMSQAETEKLAKLLAKLFRSITEADPTPSATRP